jgi:sulfite exporter TauE/SafE
MAVFGLGTAPLLILAGLGGRLLGMATRRWLYAAAAWCLVLTGAVSIGRGAMYLSLPGRPSAGCPLCSQPAAGQVR